LHKAADVLNLFSLTGTVIHGNHLGRTLGYPTANLDLPSGPLLTGKTGVYAVRVRYDGKDYDGMANIGYRPTISENGFTVEVHLFGFSDDLYGETLTVGFTERIRDEVKFGSLQELTAQMHRDEARAKKILSGLL
jgi:riboflavin kinase / FMN adenylyltransferase